MMFRAKLVSFAGALLFASQVFSAVAEVCPDINEIKATGLSMAEEIASHIYISFEISQYNTSHLWGFIVGPLESDSTESALETGNEILETITSQGMPTTDENGKLLCFYDTGIPDVFALAVPDGNYSVMKLKPYFLKAQGFKK